MRISLIREYFVYLVLLAFCLQISSCSVVEEHGKEVKANETEQANAVVQLLHRLIPEKADRFEIEILSDLFTTDGFQISSKDGKILISANAGYAAAAGVYYYLKRFCGCHISWSGAQLKLPEELPFIGTTLITFNDKYRYYQNVCTSSYSYVWWTWERWEAEIDWMALNGINLPLAFNAQEAIYKKVFKKLNFTDHDIDLLYTGPAFLAWNRMGNIQTWAGPLYDSWHEKQTELQHKILNRMRAFGMTPVLPAFSGRVVPGFQRLYPNASVVVLSKNWGHFREPYGDVTFLDPIDPMFKEIGSEFLKSYIKEFGTNHIYNADLFNEMPPPSNDTDYLHSCSQKVFETITSVDPEGIWMIQGWMFFHDPITWKPPQAKAFLTAVPLGRMLVLDLQSELYPQYTRLSSYFGQPFIWCMLHNYGGVTGLYGSLEQINMGPFEARFFDNSTMVGTGLTPEGIETNDVVYELMNEMAWRKRPVDLEKWIYDYIFRRYGTVSYSNLYAWLLLRRSVYNATVPYRNHGKYILIRRPSLKLKPYIWYDPQDVFNAWKLFLNASQERALSYSLLYRHDLVDVTRQALQLIMDNFYIKLKNSFRNKDLQVFGTYATLIVQLFQDMDNILATDKQFLLGKWLEDAKSLATTPIEAAQYEYNARNQITLWGPTGQILDYANKQWTGLMLNYYGKRWELFVNFLDDALRKQRPFNQNDFNAEVFRRVEEPFTLGLELYRNYTKGDSIEISQELLRKYENFTSRV